MSAVGGHSGVVCYFYCSESSFFEIFDCRCEGSELCAAVRRAGNGNLIFIRVLLFIVRVWRGVTPSCALSTVQGANT